MSWTHFKALIYIDAPLKRDFYLQMCQQKGWSTRTLQERLDSQLFERTALSRQPAELLAQELGADFTFVARQKRIQIEHDDFYIDLLIYNRRLKVAHGLILEPAVAEMREKLTDTASACSF